MGDHKEKKEYHKATHVFAVLLSVAATAACLHWAIRPRPAHLGMALLLLLVAWRVWRIAPLEVYEADPKKCSKSLRGYLFGLPVMLWIVLVFLSPLELAFPTHMPWEYKWEVKAMKEDAPNRYYYFPDEIPKGAKKIIWKQYPGYLQGKAFKYLIFQADEEYIRAEIEKYEADATLLTPDEAEQVSIYPLSCEVAPERREHMQIYMLYQAEDPEEYPQAMGIMVDKEQGMICYFYE